MTTGLDYSAGRIAGSTIRAAGHSFCVRYIGTPGRAKNITKVEYADLKAAGLSVWLVYENSVNDILGGFSGGIAAARAARADATSIGYPASSVIFFCADRHLAPSEIRTGLDYNRGAASVLGVQATGAYGFSEFVNAVRTNGAAAWLWQCGARNTVQPGTHLYQRNTVPASVGGIACDVNDLLLPIQPPKPAPVPVPAVFDFEEDDMSGALLRYVKGDALPNIYLVRFAMGDDEPAVSRRSVDPTEWSVVSQTGTRVAVLPQKQFDAIPILPAKVS